jgi:hypothetical protein
MSGLAFCPERQGRPDNLMPKKSCDFFDWLY